MAKRSPQSAKRWGVDTEVKMVTHLQQVWGLLVERRRLEGVLDRGDIAGIRKVVVEVKAATGDTASISTWLNELKAEVNNDSADIGFIAARPRGKPDPKDWYAVLPLTDLLNLMESVGYFNADRVIRMGDISSDTD